MIFRKCLLGVVVFALLCSVQAFCQSSSISGIITDTSGGVLPGAKVTVKNTATGIARTVVTNNAGAYSVPGLQVGEYEATAEMQGFGTQSKTNIAVNAAAQLHINFEMTVAAREDVVQVSIETENILLDQSSSVGVMLPEEKLTQLPLVNSNVLDLVKVMGGVNMTDSPTFGADRTTFAGLGASNINLQRDGVTVNDVRWSTGLSSPVFLNPELIGEFKLVIAPVDAEMGRGSGQVQVVTRSGANAFHGSALWNIQNTALDSNQWNSNLTSVAKNWRNQNEYTLSLGGPIIKNKTFFFASWDQQITRIREHNTNPQVPTPCARKGIYRYFTGYANGNYQAIPAVTSTQRSSPQSIKSVKADGTPQVNAQGYLTAAGIPNVADGTVLMQPSYMGVGTETPSQLMATSWFGPLLQQIPLNDFNCDSVTTQENGLADSSWIDYAHPWDPLRVPDTTGYVDRFMKLIPAAANNWDVGDGLNWAGYRWVRTNKGIDNVYGLGEGPNRKQITVRIDHNFSAKHRAAGSFSVENNNGEDAQPMWPTNSYGGNITRKPRSFNVSLTSTLLPMLLNEARVGYSRTESFVVSPLHNTLNNSSTKLRNLLQELYPSSQLPNYSADLPVLIGLGTQFQIYGGSHPYGSGRGNFGTYWGGHDPRWIFADTLNWTKGRHSIRIGGEVQKSQSWQAINGSSSFTTANITYPSVIVGSRTELPITAFVNGSTYNAQIPGLTGSGSDIHNLLNIYSGSLASVGQYYFVNSSKQLAYNDIKKGEDLRVTDYRQNQFNIFAQDDWKITPSLTINLGLRYEWYGVPYLANGMTSSFKGGALSAFGISGNSFADWMTGPTVQQWYQAKLNGTTLPAPKGELATVEFIGPDSPNPDRSLYGNDNNNFGPVFGFAYQLPWFGKGKTTIRGGYQMSFLTLGRADTAIVAPPGVVRDYTYTLADKGYQSLKDLPSLLPVAIPAYMKTPAANPTPPVTERQQSMSVFDPSLRTPYVHNLNLSVTRNIGSNLTVDVRYIGTLTRKQTGSVNLNAPNIFNSGFKDLLLRVRNGENPVELDAMFKGLSLCNPLNPACKPIDGTTTFAGNQLRQMSNDRFATTYASPLAEGDLDGFASYLATANINPNYNPTLASQVLPYTAGGLLRYNGVPENLILTNPQFTSVNWTGNLNHSNYHSMQAQVTLRPTHGLSLSGTYTWSRNMGMLGYDNLFNRADDYGILNTNRSHAITSYGTWDLPFGPNRALFSNVSPNIVGRIIGGWQLSWIHTMQTGRPASISTTTGMWGTGRPDRVGDFDPKSGYVTWLPGARYGTYFADSEGRSKYMVDKDPQCSAIATSLSYLCMMKAVYVANYAPDPARPGQFIRTKGDLVFKNPQPGTRGNFAPGQITTPMTWNTDMALTKVVRITEGKSFQLRVDATNVFNHPIPSNGNFGSAGSRVVAPGDFFGNVTMIDMGQNFAGRDPGFLDSKIGARTFQARIRFDF